MSKKQENNKQSETTQPKPMSGSHKVKNQNHSRQNKNSGHDM
ncbi:small acid-soluble spore protein P [Jeotgalibacillus sp. ET6]|nr:small acid-soluble spore protein P [Jeotgalibacillus sp. ET6]MDG5470454.1 small acid-soluble spore protein P [Jeotgalibacillus sp. ET6]